MNREPATDHGQLRRTVEREYGVTVDNVVFVPSAQATVCYRISDREGQRYFLKVWPRRDGALNLETIDGILAVTRMLHERRLFTRLPHPIRTRSGGVHTFLSDAPLALFPLLPGTPPRTGTRYFGRLGSTLAAIHRATPALDESVLRRERFNVWYEKSLAWRLEQIADIGRTDRPGRRALRALALPIRGEIRDLVARIHQLRTTVRALDRPLTLCHCDVGPHNMLETGGELFVVDWDNAQMSRPESDLLAGAGAHFDQCLTAYHRAGGTTNLRLEYFAFFRLRDLLQDALYRFELILDYDLSPTEDARALYGIQQWAVRRWRGLDRTLAAIGTALDRRATATRGAR